MSSGLNPPLFNHKRYIRICRPSAIIIQRSPETNSHTYKVVPKSRLVDSQLPSEFSSVEWLPSTLLAFQSNLAEVSMKAMSKVWQPHDIIGIDAASMACVNALDAQPEDTVLDLCAAPGGKAMLISEFVKQVIAVDISRCRLYTMNSLCKQHGYKNLTLLQADGCKFDPSDKTTFDATWRSKKRKAHKTAIDNVVPRSFVKVLVDAECTHDGSAKHVSKFSSLVSFQNEQSSRLSELPELQYGLLRNGWNLLDKNRSDARLIYSTCSFTREQNENVVERFLASASDASIDPIAWAPTTPCVEKLIFASDGVTRLGCAYLFGNDMEISNQQTGGLFLIRLKVASSVAPSHATADI